MPLAMDTFGRWGIEAMQELQRLPDARASADATAEARGALLRWRQELSVVL